MFRPIKNFITYIQKNASGSAIFGASSAAATANALADAELEHTANSEKQQQHPVKADKALKKPIDMEKSEEIVNEKELQDVCEESTNAYKSDSSNVNIALYDDAVDIEMQIKSSVMLKKPILTGADMTDEPELLKHVGMAVAEVIAPPPPLSLSFSSDISESKNSDHNDNHVEDVDDELADFRLDPTVTACTQSVEDFCSVGSADLTTTGEDTAEEFNTEDEDNVEERFLEFTQDIETFPGSEIIVLNDTDLNSSVASDAPSEDPLAIDDFTQAPGTPSQTPTPTLTRDTSSNTLDSTLSANEDGSMNSDMMWINISDMKSSSLTPNSHKDLADGALHLSAPLKRPALNTMIITDKDRNHTIQKSSSEENAEELRSDGSDSGLGSETSALQTTLASISDSSQMLGSASATPSHTPLQERVKTLEALCSAISNSSGNDEPTIRQRVPLRSNLKRRLDADEDVMISAVSGTTTMTTLSSTSSGVAGSLQKKPKRSINFDAVQVYYFPRQQGFSCVPSAGGCTLGMAAAHVSTKTLSLAEHAAELRRAHRLQLQEINPRGSSSDDSEESEEDYLSEGSGSDLDAESNGFLQPVSPKQRRALLKAAGVRKIDASEKAECRDIRNSREVCGCSCRDFCDPETCACNQAGIKCQVDRAMFPCGCSRDACGNTVGRVEFNPQRVRIHFIHTIMRLEMENRQQQNPPPLGVVGDSNATIGLNYTLPLSPSSVVDGTNSTAAAVVAAAQNSAAQLSNTFYGLQSHSNYSSGYASPVYSSEPTPAANYYQPQTSMHHYSGSVPALADMQLSAPPIHAPQSQYPMDSLSVSLFSGAASATPAYAELMPSYGNVSSATAPSSVYHHQSIGAYINSNVPTYSTYHHQTGPDDLSTPAPPPTTYSSCAVPSVPPFGSATTTAAAAHYATDCNVVLETTTAPSCISLVDAAVVVQHDVNAGAAAAAAEEVDGNINGDCDDDDDGDGDVGGGNGVASSGGNFIDLNTPIASATRLSQINDLLQHNRNTTAALVAVSQSANCMTMSCTAAPLVSSSVLTTNTANTASIDTPPIEELTQKNCLTFDELPSPLQPTPIVAVMLENDNAIKSPSLATVECNGSKQYPNDIESSTAISDTTTTPAPTARSNINSAETPVPTQSTTESTTTITTQSTREEATTTTQSTTTDEITITTLTATESTTGTTLTPTESTTGTIQTITTTTTTEVTSETASTSTATATTTFDITASN